MLKKAELRTPEILRPYQAEVFEKLNNFLDSGKKRGYVELPTGTGKTVLFVKFAEKLIEREASRGKHIRILVVTPTKDLVHQTLGRTRERGFGKFAPNLKVGSFFSDTDSIDRDFFLKTTFQEFTTKIGKTFPELGGSRFKAADYLIERLNGKDHASALKAASAKKYASGLVERESFPAALSAGLKRAGIRLDSDTKFTLQIYGKRYETNLESFLSELSSRFRELRSSEGARKYLIERLSGKSHGEALDEASGKTKLLNLLLDKNFVPYLAAGLEASGKNIQKIDARDTTKLTFTVDENVIKTTFNSLTANITRLFPELGGIQPKAKEYLFERANGKDHASALKAASAKKYASELVESESFPAALFAGLKKAGINLSSKKQLKDRTSFTILTNSEIYETNLASFLSELSSRFPELRGSEGARKYLLERLSGKPHEKALYEASGKAKLQSLLLSKRFSLELQMAMAKVKNNDDPNAINNAKLVFYPNMRKLTTTFGELASDIAIAFSEFKGSKLKAADYLRERMKMKGHPHALRIASSKENLAYFVQVNEFPSVMANALKRAGIRLNLTVSGREDEFSILAGRKRYETNLESFLSELSERFPELRSNEGARRYLIERLSGKSHGEALDEVSGKAKLLNLLLDEEFGPELKRAAEAYGKSILDMYTWDTARFSLKLKENPANLTFNSLIANITRLFPELGGFQSKAKEYLFERTNGKDHESALKIASSKKDLLEVVESDEFPPIFDKALKSIGVEMKNIETTDERILTLKMPQGSHSLAFAGLFRDITLGFELGSRSNAKEYLQSRLNGEPHHSALAKASKNDAILQLLQNDSFPASLSNALLWINESINSISINDKTSIRIQKEKPEVTVTTYASLGILHSMSKTALIGNKLQHTGNMQLDDFDVILLDEAHHALSYGAGYIVDSLQDKTIIGFTATPDANELRKLNTRLPEKIAEMGIKEAIDMGLLASITPVGIKSGMKIKGSEIFDSNGDFIDSKISYLASDPNRNAIIINTAKTLAGHGIGTIIACIAGQEALHARHLASELNKAGIRADAVYSAIPASKRQEIYQKFNNGEIDVLTYVGVLGEGWDSDRAKAIINARPTRSLIIAKQRLGRITRPGSDAYSIDICDEYESGNSPISVADLLISGSVPIGNSFGILTDARAVETVLRDLKRHLPVMPYIDTQFVTQQELLASLDVVFRGVTKRKNALGRDVIDYATPSFLRSRYKGITQEILDRIEKLYGVSIEKKEARNGYLSTTIYKVDQAEELIERLPQVDPDKYYEDEKHEMWISPRGLAVLFSKKYPSANENIISERLASIEEELTWIPARHKHSIPKTIYTKTEIIKMFRAEQHTVESLDKALAKWVETSKSALDSELREAVRHEDKRRIAAIDRVLIPAKRPSAGEFLPAKPQIDYTALLAPYIGIEGIRNLHGEEYGSIIIERFAEKKGHIASDSVGFVKVVFRSNNRHIGPDKRQSIMRCDKAIEMIRSGEWSIPAKTDDNAR